MRAALIWVCAFACSLCRRVLFGKRDRSALGVAAAQASIGYAAIIPPFYVYGRFAKARSSWQSCIFTIPQ
jgi:hypothetical protein